MGKKPAVAGEGPNTIYKVSIQQLQIPVDHS